MTEQTKAFSRYTVTSALPYANGPLHIGHLAGAYLPADIFVRYLRARGRDVVYICGSDEHGAAITIRARKDGVSPREVVDKYHTIIRDAFEKLNVSFDVFSRTSKPIHHETAQEFFRNFYEGGKFVEKSSQQLFDPEAGMFLADRYVQGTCPKCGNENAYGDQCEVCGTSLSPTDLINPRSTITGAKPELKETRHWYLPLDQYQDFLSKYILEDHKDWKVNVVGQCRSWLEDGLQPRAITRDLDWGVKVPIEGVDDKVLYVWFDAPIGYISATKEWAAEKGVDWKPWWQAEDTGLFHFIGKDNIVFHCLIFPAILKGHGDYILPANVPANEFLNLEGEKMSTSRNHAVWLHELVEDFPEQTDVIRYVLTAIMPETKDSNFTWEEFQSRNNSELADNLGNFVNRVTSLNKRYFDGVLQEAAAGPLQPPLDDLGLFAGVKKKLEEIEQSIENFRFREALQGVMDLSRDGNKYLADTEPWKLIKTDPEKVGVILNHCVQLMGIISRAARPFIPETADKIAAMVGITNNDEWPNFDRADHWIPAGQKIEMAPLLFPHITDEQVEAQREKLNRAVSSNPQAAPAKEFTSFDEFMKMDIRVVTILEAARVPKADKLLQLKVDTGFDTRIILSGVAEHYAPEELQGRKALAIVNLPPRKLRGIDSNGMLLFAEDHEGKLRLVGPADDAPNGAIVR